MVVAVDVLPVIPTTLYVNIGPLLDTGDNNPFVNIVIKSPSLTVPETLTFTLLYVNVIVFPDDKVVLSITKFGFNVYAEVVNPVLPVKNPLGAALLKTSSMYESSNGIPNVLPEVESTNKGYLMFILFLSGIGAMF